MTTYNCITAIIAGVVGYCIVLVSGSKTDPFVAGVVLDVCAVLLMLWTWNENKGATNSASNPCDEQVSESDTTDDKIPEGTIGNLKDDHPEKADGIPYGAIFSAFMATMVLGTMLFRFSIRTVKSETTDEIPLFSAILPTLILCATFFVSALSFLIVAFSRGEFDTYLAFLLLEFCNGVYVPSMAYHRSLIVNDSSRAMVYGFMNIPLFIFVVIAVYATSSNGEQRQTLFASSALLPIVAALAVVLGFGLQNIRSGFSQVKTGEADSAEKDVLEVENIENAK
ncbi:hypothetical protein ABKA04_009859 [Annulohypoxylon sp. FPYF3050]